MQIWKSKMVITLEEAGKKRQEQERQRVERLSDLSDAASVVADLLVARDPSLEAQPQSRLDAVTLEVRKPGGAFLTLHFQLIDPPWVDINLADYSAAERQKILASYSLEILQDGRIVGPDRPEMTITLLGHADLFMEVNPLSLHNPYLPAEEDLDPFLTRIEILLHR